MLFAAAIPETATGKSPKVRNGMIEFPEPARAKGQTDVLQLRCDPIPVVRVAFIGLGMRGSMAVERKNKIIIPSEKRTIAYHEAGHATVSWVLEHANPLIKVTIIPRGKALGAAWYLPEERQITTKEQMLDEMAAILGGRASELLNFGKVSTGALNDLERVTKQAYAMVAYYGMSSEVGNLSFYDSTGQNDMALTKPYSERTAQEIDAEVKKLIDGAFQRSLETLEKHRAGLTQLAELLLEREVIFAEDLEKIFGKRKGEIRKELEVKIEEPLNSEPSAE